MPFQSKRLRLQLRCVGGSHVGVRMAPKTIWPCVGRFDTRCSFDSCGRISPVVVCPATVSEPCAASPVVDTPVTPWVLPQDPVPIELDQEDPEVVLLRPEHLPRLRGQLQMELAQIDEIAQRKGEIENRLEELDSVEKELKKRSG